MEIRVETVIPKKHGRERRFPELFTLKIGQVAVYPLSENMRVRAACAFIKRLYGIQFVTRSNVAEDEISVRIKPVKKEK